MHRTKALLVGTVVIALVAMVGWLEWRGRQRAAEIEQLRAAAAEFTAVREEVTRLKAADRDVAELEALRDSDLRLREEVARLRGQLGARLRAEAEREAKSPVEEAPEATTDIGIAERSKRIANLHTQLRVAQMKGTLNLTSEQERAITGILLGQSESGSAGGTPEEQIKAVLSLDQLARYEADKSEEANSNARSMATAQLGDLLMAVTLDPEQRDKAFAVLHDNARRGFDGLFSEQPPPSSHEAFLEWVISRKIKAVEGILDAGQLERYREFLERRMRR